MGRGLSDLQVWILRRAAATEGTLRYREILLDRYGWPAPARARTASLGSQVFRPAEIGEAEYGRVYATLSRSCVRLGARGLVDCMSATISHWSGVRITDAGRAWVEAHPEKAVG